MDENNPDRRPQTNYALITNADSNNGTSSGQETLLVNDVNSIIENDSQVFVRPPPLRQGQPQRATSGRQLLLNQVRSAVQLTQANCRLLQDSTPLLQTSSIVSARLTPVERNCLVFRIYDNITESLNGVQLIELRSQVIILLRCPILLSFNYFFLVSDVTLYKILIIESF